MRSVTPLMPVDAKQARINSRFRFRVAMFQRRGMSPMQAGEFAYRLECRDADFDDRRACVECESLQRSGTCFQAVQNRLPNTTKDYQPVRDQLKRCDGFSFQKP